VVGAGKSHEAGKHFTGGKERQFKKRHPQIASGMERNRVIKSVGVEQIYFIIEIKVKVFYQRYDKAKVLKSIMDDIHLKQEHKRNAERNKQSGTFQGCKPVGAQTGQNREDAVIDGANNSCGNKERERW
jgi:hypothetical protein